MYKLTFCLDLLASCFVDVPFLDRLCLDVCRCPETLIFFDDPCPFRDLDLLSGSSPAWTSPVDPFLLPFCRAILTYPSFAPRDHDPLTFCDPSSAFRRLWNPYLCGVVP
jgi:hypothetical protein